MKGLGFDLGAEPPCIKFCQEPILLSTPQTNSAFLHSRKRQLQLDIFLAS